MVVKFKLIDKRTRVSKDIEKLQKKVADIQPEFMKRLVSEIVLQSPVDTGTYMDAHNVGVVGSSTSSAGKPQNQPWQVHADKAIERLYAQIDSLPVGVVSFIANNSLHAPKVEYEYPYAPYTIARGKAESILKDVIMKVMRGQDV